MRIFIPLVLALSLSGCSTPGSSATTAITPTQGAQNIGGSQGQAQASETGSTSAQANPVIVNALAARKVTIGVKPGEATIEIDGAEDSEVNIGTASFGNQTFGNENSQEASTSSGGGAAGGAGSAERK